MAIVTVGGGIQSSSALIAAAAQTAMNAITASVVSGVYQALSYSGSGTLPSSQRATDVAISAAGNLTIPTGLAAYAVVSTAPGQVNLVDNGATPVTIVSGSGGLVLDRSALSAGAALVLASGGTNAITLGAGQATVGVDGVSTVSALGGAASILSAASGHTLIQVGGADTVGAGGTDTIAFGWAPLAQVTALDGSNVVFSSQSGAATPIVAAAPGNEILGTLAGSTATVSGSAGGMMLVSAWGGRSFLNPGGANVTVFAGSGTETLFGAGDASLPGVALPVGTALSNTGSDFVFGGSGYFHGGSGPIDMLMTSTLAGAATLVGGGAVDILFSQGAGDSLRGAAGTVVMDAAGYAQAGFSVAGAAGGDVLDAGASNAFIFGAAWGANTILSGAGAATVWGNHGTTGRVGNTYIDGGGGGSLSIVDFLPGADVVSLRGDTVARTVTVTTGQPGTPGTFVTLGDGTTIGFVDEFLTQAQVTAAFK